jgi:hypothetical protein
VSYSMKRTVQKCFHISNKDVNQGQPFRSLFRWRHFFLMFVPFLNDVHSRKSIGTNTLPISKMPFHKRINLFTGNSIHSPHGNKSSGLTSVFNRYQYRLFPFCTTSSFARLLAAYIGVVKLYHFVQKPIKTIPVSHCRTNLFQHTSGGWPRYSDMLGKTQSGNTTFVRGNKVDGPKPFNQRKICRMKQRSGSNRNLMPASGALINSSSVYEPCRIMAAFWTDEPVRPPIFE